jgi:protein involved in polysaccharide export with SLBB domain
VTVDQEAGRLPGPNTPVGSGSASTYNARLNSKGEVAMPLLGWVKIEGLTLLETQEKLTDLYYPSQLKLPPTIVVNLVSYATQPVTILGAVNSPGTFELQGREMSLVSLLAKCGGIHDGASVIRVKRDSDPNMEPIILPITGLDNQFVDVELKAGDVVEVEALNQHVISVIGLVNSATSFPYPNYLKLNLLQAVARAGGLNAIADPHWATIYRLKKDGSIIAGHFRISGGDEIPSGATVILKPGDVISIDNTWYTDTRLILVAIVRVGVGFGASPNLVN